MRGLVALDLDGTLLDEDCGIPVGHEHAVDGMRRAGFAVAIVTGRPLLSSRWIHAHLRLDTPMGCFNGGWVGHPGSAPFAWAPLPESDVRRILAVLAGRGGSRSCYPDADTWCMDAETALTRGWSDLYRVPIRIGADDFATWSGPSCKVMFVADPVIIPATALELRGRFGADFQVVISQRDRIEILPGPISKAWGLERLAAFLGVPRERVWAVGDNDNDREMIQWAGHGCAMGQASEAVRALARHVLPGVAARGLCALVPMLEKSG